ncbi:MAG: diacylglycerol kinase family lipid kinase [Planctomycetes bacterium]|nr:diacylglycerol kinase family lipid kinase [Planctomycetota bacterium]
MRKIIGAGIAVFAVAMLILVTQLGTGGVRADVDPATIDFEGLAEGATVSTVSCGTGMSCSADPGGFVGVFGDSADPGIQGNAAMIFDATCAGGCSGGDNDLFFPGHGNILIITNPASNHGRGARAAGLAAARLRARGAEPEIRETKASGDAERIATEAITDRRESLRCVVACGGDGTIQEVANALAKARAESSAPPLGLIPAGRCNDFAHALGIPTDPTRAADLLIEGTARRIDLGRVTGRAPGAPGPDERYFCTVATIGIDSEVSSYVDGMRGPLKGTVAYLYGALCVLRRYQAKTVRLSGDFGVIEQSIFLASSANTRLYGGSIPIAPDADPTDGLLDLCVIDAVSKLRALTLIPTVLAARHRSRRGVRIIQTKRFTIDADEPLEIWADGERIARTPATIEAAPAALRVVLPGNA